MALIEADRDPQHGSRRRLLAADALPDRPRRRHRRIPPARLAGRDARAAGKAPLPGIGYPRDAAELGLPDLHAVTSAALYAAARARPAEDGTVWFADAADA